MDPNTFENRKILLRMAELSLEGVLGGVLAPPEFEVSEKTTEREIDSPRFENRTIALNFTYTGFPHIVSEEIILFWIWKAKGHSTVHKGKGHSA